MTGHRCLYLFTSSNLFRVITWSTTTKHMDTFNASFHSFSVCTLSVSGFQWIWSKFLKKYNCVWGRNDTVNGTAISRKSTGYTHCHSVTLMPGLNYYIIVVFHNSHDFRLGNYNAFNSCRVLVRWLPIHQVWPLPIPVHVFTCHQEGVSRNCPSGISRNTTHTNHLQLFVVMFVVQLALDP